MLTNLFTSLVIAFGVGVSSVNMDHNINSKADNIYQFDEITNFSDCENYYNVIDKIYLRDLDFNNPSNVFYILPSYDDLMDSFYGTLGYSRGIVVNFKRNDSDSYDSLRCYFDLSSTDYALMVELSNGSRVPIYTLSDDYQYDYSGFFEGLNILGVQYPSYDITSSYFTHDSEIAFNNTIALFIFYLSEYSFSGSVYDLSQSKPVSLFSTALLDDYFGFSSIHGEKVVYKGWFNCNGVYYDSIKITCIDAQGTKYSNGKANYSTSIQTINSTADIYIYVMNVCFTNSITNTSYFAYLPRYYAIDDTLSTYVDVSYNGWNISNVEFISISFVGSPQVRSDLVNLGYYKVITHENDLVSSNTNINSSWLNNSFSLINGALFGLGGLFSIQILPFVNLGTLIFLPLLFVIVLFVVKLFKR